jgi:hypothetical protein
MSSRGWEERPPPGDTRSESSDELDGARPAQWDRYPGLEPERGEMSFVDACSVRLGQRRVLRRDGGDLFLGGRDERGSGLTGIGPNRVRGNESVIKGM